MRRFLFVLFIMVMIPYVTTLAWTGRLERSNESESVGMFSGVGYLGQVLGIDSGYEECSGMESGGEERSGTGSGATWTVITAWDDKKLAISVEEFLVHVLAAQIPAEFGAETLKAQAILARTYIYSLMGGAGEIYEEELDMDALSTQQMKILWGEKEYPVMFGKLQTAVKDTAGQYIIYEGKMIEPLFCYVSAGKTRSRSDAYPYLKQAESPGDLLAENYRTMPVFELREFVKRINEIPGAIAVSEEEFADGGGIQIVERDGAGYVKTVQIGQKTYTGEEVQYALGLNSSWFSFEHLVGKIRVICKGIGHGYGFSQFGANEMEKSGSSYADLLNHYFQNIEIVSTVSK